ncbi:universal stress protein [Halorarum salinum]|uniref:Universal stress protein n=1 Tax=Halorarum salinum TaxID=2743089 RepID=A0A7D5LB47_9EURY|nr:universal stress protein [Halobaculum salinum]QLG62307.1 universal stress protein [Halobaculum salinum]
MYDDVLLPVDGSDGTGAALAHAESLGTTYGATVHVLHVADTNRDSVTTLAAGNTVDVLSEKGTELVEEVSAALDPAVSRRTEVLQGDPHDTIVDYANEYGIDLIVMATHGRRGLERFLLGSVTDRVVRTADVPVLTVRLDEAA